MSKLKRALASLTRAIPLAALLLATIGYGVRDRAVIFALLMYLPLVPLALLTLLWDLILRGRSVGRYRFVASVFAVLVGLWGATNMIGSGATSAAASSSSSIKLVQWNVQWGGRQGDTSWRQIIGRIAAQVPDVVVLNEAPADAQVAAMCSQLGGGPGSGWTFVSHANRPGSPYWFRLVVASRWSVKMDAIYTMPNGAAIGVSVTSPRGTLRVLVVDGISRPTILRTPLLRAVMQTCRDADSAGVPFDIIAGDFNTLSRSIGFDALREAGFVLASSRAGGWRGTFPSALPLYDIDHVWIAPDAGVTATSCQMLTSLSTNHRGQAVTLTIK